MPRHNGSRGVYVTPGHKGGTSKQTRKVRMGKGTKMGRNDGNTPKPGTPVPNAPKGPQGTPRPPKK